MYRQTLLKTSAAGPATIRGLALQQTSRRAFTTTHRAMAAGDTGAPSKTGTNDAFQKREKAQEDYAIRERETKKLVELKKKLAEQQKHLQKLSDHIDEITRSQGGEKN